jgi:hypothetical protein
LTAGRVRSYSGGDLPTRVRVVGVNAIALGVVVGAAYGVWNMIETARDPLADDTPTSLLLFYGPMFALWATAGFTTARRTGRTLDGIAIGAMLALVTFSVFWVANLVRINVFFDAVLPRADWRNMLAKFQTSGFTDLRTFVIYDYLKDAPLKLFSATLIGAITGTVGAVVASIGRPLRSAIHEYF